MLAKLASGSYNVLGKEKALLILEQPLHLVDVDIPLDAGPERSYGQPLMGEFVFFVSQICP